VKTKEPRERKRIRTPRTVPLLIRLQPDALKALREAASAEDASMTNLIGRAGAEHLERRAIEKLNQVAEVLGAEKPS